MVDISVFLHLKNKDYNTFDGKHFRSRHPNVSKYPHADNQSKKYPLPYGLSILDIFLCLLPLSQTLAF